MADQVAASPYARSLVIRNLESVREQTSEDRTEMQCKHEYFPSKVAKNLRRGMTSRLRENKWTLLNIVY